jgi:hypothetical protein
MSVFTVFTMGVSGFLLATLLTHSLMGSSSGLFTIAVNTVNTVNTDILSSNINKIGIHHGIHHLAVFTGGCATLCAHRQFVATCDW